MNDEKIRLTRRWLLGSLPNLADEHDPAHLTPLGEKVVMQLLEIWTEYGDVDIIFTKELVSYELDLVDYRIKGEYSGFDFGVPCLRSVITSPVKLLVLPTKKEGTVGFAITNSASVYVLLPDS